jgi:hypothetical protein
MRLTFVSHFVISLAIAVGLYFAWANDLLHTIWTDDLSRMTSVIAALVAGTTAYLGWQAWLADERAPVDDEFGHLAERLSVMCGLMGTAFGLYLQGNKLSAGGGASFEALSTSLFTTMCGILGAVLIAIMQRNLDAGINRAANDTQAAMRHHRRLSRGW